MEEIEDPPIYLKDLCNLFGLWPPSQYAPLLLLLAKLQDSYEQLEKESVFNFLKISDLSLNYQQICESLNQLERAGLLKREESGLFIINKIIPSYESMKLIEKGDLSFNLNVSYTLKKKELDYGLTGKKAKEKKKASSERASEGHIIKKVVDYLNLQTGKNFRPQTSATRSSILGRLREGYTFSDFKSVIDGKVLEWAHNPEMAKFLRPTTLFTPSKFEAYLNEFENSDSVEVDQKEKIKENFREALMQKLRQEKDADKL